MPLRRLAHGIARARPKANVYLFLMTECAVPRPRRPAGRANARLRDRRERASCRIAPHCPGVKARQDGCYSGSARRVHGDKVDAPRRPIGVVTIAGMIVAQVPAGPPSAHHRQYTHSGVRAMSMLLSSASIARAARSPRGRIRHALLAAKANGLPVVVSMGNVAPGRFLGRDPGRFSSRPSLRPSTLLDRRVRLAPELQDCCRNWRGADGSRRLRYRANPSCSRPVARPSTHPAARIGRPRFSGSCQSRGNSRSNRCDRQGRCFISNGAALPNDGFGGNGRSGAKAA